MESKINCLNVLLSAFESRNEVLHEEIEKNEQTIREMKEELTNLLNPAETENSNESGIKMVD